MSAVDPFRPGFASLQSGLGLPCSKIPKPPWPVPASSQNSLLLPSSVQWPFHCPLCLHVPVPSALSQGLGSHPSPHILPTLGPLPGMVLEEMPVGASRQDRAGMDCHAPWSSGKGRLSSPPSLSLSGGVSAPIGSGFWRNTFPGRAASSASQPHQWNHSPPCQAHPNTH